MAGRADARAVVVLLGALAWLISPGASRAAESDPVERAINARSMFPKGTWTSQFYGAYYESVVEDEAIGSLVASGGYYFDDRHVFRVELVAHRLDDDEPGPDADTATATGGNLALRYHFLEHQRLSLFFEGLAGFFYGTRNFPAGGTHFNFNQQLGLGLTWRLRDNLHLIGGARYITSPTPRSAAKTKIPASTAWADIWASCSRTERRAHADGYTAGVRRSLKLIASNPRSSTAR
jgi:hypothetical protein